MRISDWSSDVCSSDLARTRSCCGPPCCFLSLWRPFPCVDCRPAPCAAAPIYTGLPVPQQAWGSRSTVRAAEPGGPARPWEGAETSMQHPKTIVIPGSASGIDEALAHASAAPGAFLALPGRARDPLATREHAVLDNSVSVRVHPRGASV